MADSDFLIVGLGASAGGIKAFREFFLHVPPKSGFAYVVILHLSPEHESHLAEVLQLASEMPVRQVQGRVAVEPDHVYVIPPNQSLALLDGHLALSAVQRVEERRAPIDIFFRTLAEAKGPWAVSVVLSGTGADGSMGMKRVKECGGVCFVQDPAEAEHAGMPLNCIATALVDQVLPVAQIPARILAYDRSRRSVRFGEVPGDGGTSSEAALQEVFTLLRARTGHDFSNYKRSTILRRVERRVSVHGLPDLAAYARFVRDDAGEAQALLKDLLISVTNFFRDCAAFETLERIVIPRLFEGKSADEQVRVWIAGCATGEEAYSIAMLLAEAAARLPAPPGIHLFATDIDEAAVATAREGLYSAVDTADVPAERLQRFFSTEGDGYRVNKEVRDTVLFAEHNLIKDPPFSHLDMVSCRNLLIYLNRTAQQRVMEVLHFALNPGACLFLGSSESADGAGDLFVALDKDAHIFQSRAIGSRMALPIAEMSPVRSRARQLGEPNDHPRHRERLSYADLHQRLLEQYGPPSVVVNHEHEILHLSERAGQYLQFAGGEPSHNLLKAIRPDLRLELRSALYQAAHDRTNVEAKGLAYKDGQATRRVDITVRPVLREQDTARGFFLILFDEAAAGREGSDPVPVPITVLEPARRLEEEVIRLKAQLRSTIEQHEAQAEELKASNEELQAMNEELRSSAEELETSKEELQSVNEELTTVNQELKIKVDEQTQAGNDIQNLINSSDIGAIFLDRASRIKLFTPRVRDTFSLIPSDRGRPLSDITNVLVDQNLSADVARVLERLERVEREVATQDGRWQLMRVLPYRTTEDRIDGVVLTFVDITERRRTEERLRESEERLRAIVGQSSAGIARTDLSGRITFVNQKACDMLGYEQHELIGRLLPELAAPGHETDTSEQFRRLAQRGLAFQLEERLLCKDGGTVWVNVSVSPMADARGKHDSAVAVLVEITERKRVETELRAVAERLQLATEAAHMYSWEVELSTGRVSYGANVVDVLGFRPPEDVGSAQAFIHPDDADATREAYDAALQARHRFSFEHRVVSPAGASVWVHVSGFVLRDGTGAAARLVGVAQNITERKHAEESIRESEARLRLVVDTVADYAILTVDNSGRIESWNPGAARAFGYEDREAIGQPYEILFTPEDRRKRVPAEELKEAVERGVAIDERWHITRSGALFYASGTMSPLRNTRGELTGFVKIARDLTERKQYEDALQRAHDELENRVLSRTRELAGANATLETEVGERRANEERVRALLKRLVTIQEDERRRIARDLHDHLGQQMTALRLNLAALKERPAGGEAQELATQADRIAEQLDADVDFLAWELRPASLDDVGLAGTLGRFVREWSKHYSIGAEFHTSGLAERRLPSTTETNLYRIAQEAMNNVYKHAQASHVDVILERRDNQVVLIVEDDGVGFEPSGPRNTEDARGLGLTGMAERAMLAGGTLDLETAPGRGATIFVRVPDEGLTEQPGG